MSDGMSTELPRKPRRFDSKSTLCIVRSKYNERYTQSLLDNCIEELRELLPKSQIHVVETPGGFEVPVTVEHVFETLQPHVVIAFGVIIRGGTPHADLIASSITDSLQEIAVRRIKPVIHEVLLVNDEDQAYARCIGSELNRGREAARAACEIVRTFSQTNHTPIGGIAPI